MQTPKPLSCLLIKPAGSECNLRCAYCFSNTGDAPPPDAGHRMSLATLDLIMRQALGNGRSPVSFIWQGGEPTVMGIDFYRKAVELHRRYAGDRQVVHSLQTNGLLIDDTWCAFLRENAFLVGLSLDGPEHVHDRYRRAYSGEGSWRRVSRAAGRLLEAGVLVNAMSCVTAYSAPRVHEVYAFLKATGFTYMQFIPVIERDRSGRAASFSVSPEQYGAFLCDLCDLWLADFKEGNPTTSVRLFDTLFFMLRGQPAPECGFMKTCGAYLAIGPAGDAYPCDFFVSAAHRLGNVREASLEALLHSDRQRLFGQAKARLDPECLRCEWLRLCRGGCLKDRRNNPEGFRKNYFCGSMRQFLAHAVPVLKALAARWSPA